MKKIFFGIILLYPFLWVIDKLNDTNWLIQYHSFISDWWLLGLVIASSFYLIKKDKYYKYDIREEVRVNQFLHEVERYDDTPYIAPTMLKYLKNPPSAYSPFLWDYVNNTFYRTVVNEFRDRVYILKDFNSFEPYNRSSILSVMGAFFTLKTISYYAIPLVWIGYSLIKYGISFINSWHLLTIPLIVWSLYRGNANLHALLLHTSKRLDEDIEAEDANRLVTWREAFPDRPVGQTFIRAYYLEMERRMRQEATLQNRIVPERLSSNWNNSNYAPFLYPDKNMPAWENEYEAVYNEKVAQQPIPAENSDKVVPFKRIQ